MFNSIEESKFNRVDSTHLKKFRTKKEITSHLHSNDRINEEQHSDEQTDIRQCFERLYKGPQKNANGVTLTQ